MVRLGIGMVVAAVLFSLTGCPTRPTEPAPDETPTQTTTPMESTADAGGSELLPEGDPAATGEPTGEAAVDRPEPKPLSPAVSAEPLENPEPVEAAADPAPVARDSSAGLPNPLRGGEAPSGAEVHTAIQANPKVRSDKRGGKHGGEPFDPIKENGPIFVDWPKPKLAMVVTGEQHGYIEPCGCAGLDRMKGGMSRRHSLFRYLEQKSDWKGSADQGPLETVGMDVGGIARGYGRQAEMKFQIMVDGMRTMGYDAITLGTTELRLPAGELLSVTANMGDGRQSPFLSANVALFGFDAGLTSRYRVVEAAGMKLGITGVWGKKYQREVHNDEVEVIDPAEALENVMPELEEKADYLVLLAHATMDETVALAKRFPRFDLVVTAGGAPQPPSKPERIEGTDALLIEVGDKGMDAIVLGLYDDPKQPLRYQRVPLDSRFPASREMHLLMVAYQDQLKRVGFAGLGLRPVPHPQQETNGAFVGSKKCFPCHEESTRVWRRSGHGRAYQTLVDLNPPRNFDPECVSCHVIGWHPTKYFPYDGGYKSLKETPHLIDTGCETCHGPGEAHVNAEMGSDEELQRKLQQAMVVTKEASEQRQCMTCHDLDNSPDFDFKTYWPHVEHYEGEE